MITRTLYRPVGASELAAIVRSTYARFPPRLVGQSHFMPVRTRAYAEQIARDAASHGSAGYVTRFEVACTFLDRFEVHVVGARVHEEYRIPAGELEAFNDAIVGKIEVVAQYSAATGASAHR